LKAHDPLVQERVTGSVKELGAKRVIVKVVVVVPMLRCC
jgi:hypothetical protein